MTVVCGTDLSPNSMQASEAAALIAMKMNVPLKLVHVIDEFGAEYTIRSDQDFLYDPVRLQMEAMAENISARYEINVETIVEAGRAAEKLIEIANSLDASMIVISTHDNKKPHSWLLGITAERIATLSPRPVLIIHEKEAIEDWVRNNAVLKLMVGVEFDETSRTALNWAAKLREVGPCDIHVFHVVSANKEHKRLGIEDESPADGLNTQVEKILNTELRNWVGELPGEGISYSDVVAGGRTVSDLHEVSKREKVDLMVVGMHQRRGLDRIWRASVSQGLVHQLRKNIACIPMGSNDPKEIRITEYKSVLIPTDFSECSKQAIALGYGMVLPHGRVHLLHVLSNSEEKESESIVAAVKELIPQDAKFLGIQTQIEVVKADNAAEAIAASAERNNVTAICVTIPDDSQALDLDRDLKTQELFRVCRHPIVLLKPERSL